MWLAGTMEDPVELLMARSPLFKMGVLAHAHVCVALVGPALQQAVSRRDECRTSAEH